MNEVPVLWWEGSRGYWDHGMLMAMFEGRLWPVSRPFSFVEYLEKADVGNVGCIVVVAGRWVHEKVAELNAFIAERSWTLVIVASDEETVFPADQINREAAEVIVQTPRHPHPANGRMILGWTGNTRMEMPTSLPDEPRLNLWAFSGQINNPQRRACLKVLEGLPGGFLNATEGFGQGVPYPDYLRMLWDTAIIPSPSGSFTPDCFRTWESLEAGCLPVVNAQSPRGDRNYPGGYYSWVTGGEKVPFPEVEDWNEFADLVAHYSENPLELLTARNRAGAWWLRKKREFVHGVQERVCAVSGTRPASARLRSDLTVLMPTSPIPSNPSLGVIEKSIRKVREYDELAECEIVIMIDGVRPEQEARRADYEEFKRRLIWRCNHDPEWAGILPLVFDAHSHQATMTREALKLVETPFVFFVEHDTWPVGDIDFEGIVHTIAHRPGPKMVRLHHIERIHPEHEYLMVGEEPIAYSRETDDGPRTVKLWPTMQWSQRPHIAPTTYYRWIVGQHFGAEAKTMIEDVMWSVIYNQMAHHKAHWTKFGVCVYMPDRENIRSSETCDGRGEDPKFDMQFAYDGAKPVGAPGGLR